MTAIEALEQAASEFERDRQNLLNLSAQEVKQRKYIRGPAAERSSAVYESDLRSRAAVFAECARRLRERAKAMRSEEAS